MDKISCFSKPVTNTSKQKQITWKQLYKNLIDRPPIKLKEYSKEEKAKNGSYYCRGLIEGQRSDENLQYGWLAIYDVDTSLNGHPLPTPEAIHDILSLLGIVHAVHNSANVNEGRCRIVIPTKRYRPDQTQQVTEVIYSYLLSLDLKFKLTPESYTLSQPFFFPQTTDPGKHKAYGLRDGDYFTAPLDFKIDSTSTDTALEYDQVEIEKVQVEMDIRAHGFKKTVIDEILKLFEGMWEGDYQSHSEADLALCNYLSLVYKGDPGTIDATFRQSGLMRDKWERKDYRDRTVKKAIAYYNKNKSKDKTDYYFSKHVQLFRDEKIKEFSPLKWAVKKFLPTGLAIIGGRPKVGKSFLCIDIADSVANGSQIFNKFETEKGTTLYVSFEDNERRINARLNGMDKGNSGQAYVVYGGYPVSKGFTRDLKNFKEVHPDLKCVIVDTMAHIIPKSKPKNQSDYDFYYPYLSKLQRFAHELEIALVLIHHTRKSISVDNPFDELLGTTALQGTCDTLIVIKRKPTVSEGKFIVTSRDYGEKALEMQFDEDKLVWTYIQESYIFEIDNKNDKAIIEFIKMSNEQRAKAKDITTATSINYNTVLSRLKRLTDNKKLVRLEKGLYGLPNLSVQDYLVGDLLE